MTETDRNARRPGPRQVAVLPLAALLLTASLMACGGSGSRHDAAATCRKAPGVAATAQLMEADATTAAEVVGEANLRAVDPTPWSDLDPQHFVARCAFVDPVAKANAPTTVCPNGDSVALQGTTQFLADDDGRMTPDPIALDAASESPC